MPSTDVHGERPLVCCRALPGATWFYGFHSNVSASEMTDLGIVPGITGGGYRPGLLVGVSAPKPAKLLKVSDATGYDGSFCDAANIDTALAAGYKMVRPIQRRFGSRGKNSRTVYITVAPLNEAGEPSGVEYKYAWVLPDFSHTRISTDLTALGIQVATGSETDLVWGVNKNFKPRRAYKLFTLGTGRSSQSSVFVDPSKYNNLPTGWALR